MWGGVRVRARVGVGVKVRTRVRVRIRVRVRVRANPALPHLGIGERARKEGQVVDRAVKVG